MVFHGWSVRCPIWFCMCNLLFSGALFVIALLDLAARTDVSEGLGGVEVLLGLGFSRRAYLIRLIPETSSHCRCCNLILCDITLNTRMHRGVDRTKVMEILLLNYTHVL